MRWLRMSWLHRLRWLRMGWLHRLPDRLEYELGWMALGFLFGVSFLTASPSAAVQLLLPGWAVPAWVAGFLLSGLGGVAGCVMTLSDRRSRRILGLIIERLCITVQTAVVGTWAAAVLYVWLNTRTPFPVILVCLVAVWMAINVVRERRIAFLVKPDTPPQTPEE